MKITCSMAEDLLPLYVEDSCSADSRKALEAHIKDCPNCRDVYTRMTAPEIPAEEVAPLVDCGKKIKKRRIRRVLIAIPLGLLAAFVLVVLALTFWSVHLELNPIVHEKEAGIWNLTAGELTTTIGEVDEYVFYTNYEQLQVFSETEDITVMLWNTEYPDDYILINDGDKDPRYHTFGGLTSSFRYRITCVGPEDTVITVSEGRRAHFLQNLASVLEALISVK